MERAINNKNYTYKDYVVWPQDQRLELIDGKPYAMSPAPSRIHQKIITEISRKIGNHIENNNGKCEVYVAPFDVLLINDDEEKENCKNIVQPDITVICDENKLDDKGCNGAPDFIIEVVSPSNSSVDYIKKLWLYEKYKVKEYWIVDPMKKSILVYRLNEQGVYPYAEAYTFKDIIKINIFQELAIDFNDFLK